MITLYIPYKEGSFLPKIVKQDWGLSAVVDEQLRVYEHLLPKIISREEIVSVRFSPHGIRIPASQKIPIIATKPDDADYREHVGYAGIPLVIVAHLKDFPQGLAMLDEYDSKEEMIKDIFQIYKHELGPNNVLSAYFLADLGALDPVLQKRLGRDQ